jgi:hypothetical protein
MSREIEIGDLIWHNSAPPDIVISRKYADWLGEEQYCLRCLQAGFVRWADVSYINRLLDNGGIKIS